MAATTQEEILSGILPRVSIEKITLTTSSSNLEVGVELNIKEVLDNNFFGSWFDDINIKKYILIDVVQSTDSRITEALSFSNDMIRLCNKSRSQNSVINANDIKTKALSYITGLTSLSDVTNLLQTSITRNAISINEPAQRGKDISNYPGYVNSDGEKVYEIPYKTNFTINNIQPEHLAYFAVCSIDIQTLCSELNIDYDIAEALEENGKVVSEIVIENSKIAGHSYVFVDENGVAWSGPVHQNESEQWKSGDDETPDSIILSRVLVSNTKIQDFRHFAEIQRLMLDFNQQKRDDNGKIVTNAFNLNNTLNKVTKIQGIDYKPDGNIPQFTQIFSSYDSIGNIKFLFGIEFINVLKSYSKFSKLYNSNNETFKNESISNTKILDLKLYRRRVKSNISLNNSLADYVPEKFNDNESDEIILQTKDESWRNFLSINNEKSSIRETQLFVDTDNDYMRYFTGVDKSFKDLTDGIYQYYVELEIEDGIIQLIKDQMRDLNIAKNELIKYYNLVSIPTMRKFLIETQNPHIDSPRETSNNSTITDYGYDLVLNKLSPQLVDKILLQYTDTNAAVTRLTQEYGSDVVTNLTTKYGGATSIAAPWNSSAAIFSAALDIFSEGIQTSQDRTNIITFLTTNLMPNSTNPSIISKIIEMIDYFISSLSNTFDINMENLNSSSPTSSSSTKTNRSFKIVKFFNEIFDSNSLKSFNIDYMSTSVNDSENDDGLRILTKNKMAERVSNEMLKFFTGEDLNLNFSGENENISQNMKYSFLTPTRLDFENRTIMLSVLQNESSNLQNRTIEDFYNSTNKYEKAISIYSDMLNFKLDTNGKNRLRLSSTEQQRTNLSPSERAAAQRREEILTSRKINDLFSDYANLTIERFSTIQSINILGNSNIKSLNNLMSSLSSGAIRSNQTNNNSYNTKSSNSISNIVSNSQIDFVKELANKNPNDITMSPRGRIVGLNNSSIGFYPQFYKIPNQIRALIFKPQQLSNNVKNNLDYNGDYKTYIRNKTINYFNFEMIGEIQYLSGFENVVETNILNLNKPTWKTLTKEYIDNITSEREILCRIKSFRNIKLNINGSSDLEKRFYDKYFIIKTTSNQQAISVTGFVINNPFIGNILEDIRRGLPGVRIRESNNISSLLNNIPSSIEIIRTDNSGNRNILEVKDIRDVLARDINKSANNKTGNLKTPAIASYAAQALSISSQQAHINNNFKSSNHVSGRNISRGMASVRPNMRDRTSGI